MYPWFLVCVVHLAGTVPSMCDRHFVSRSDCLEALHSVNEFYIPVCQKGRSEQFFGWFPREFFGVFCPEQTQ